MTRPRVPSIYGFIQLIARSIALAGDIGSLATQCYVISHWSQFAASYGLGIATAIIALLTDIAEVSALLDSSRKLGRTHPCCLIFLDILVMGMGIGGFILIAMSDYGYGNAPEGYPRPWQDMQGVAGWVLIGVVAYRFILSIWTCVDCGTRRKREKAAKRAAKRAAESNERDQSEDSLAPGAEAGNGMTK